MELGRIAVRAAFTFIALLALLRCSGKRSVVQGSSLDFVVALIVGDMIDDGVYGQSPMSHMIVGASSVILAHIVTSLIALSSPRFHDLTEGKSAVLLRDGAPDGAILQQERVSIDELGEHLRHQGLVRKDWKQVSRAILETHGHVSVLLREPFKKLQKRDRPRLREVLK
jgi:uncharacterized membrane protein YcaP (DUF421 family)